jgi:hypothetical protein
MAVLQDKMEVLQDEMASLKDKMAVCQSNDPLLRYSRKEYERRLRCINKDMDAGHERF